MSYALEHLSRCDCEQCSAPDHASDCECAGCMDAIRGLTIDAMTADQVDVLTSAIYQRHSVDLQPVPMREKMELTTGGLTLMFPDATTTGAQVWEMAAKMIAAEEALRKVADKVKVVTHADAGKARICSDCAKELSLWEEWKANHNLYDHASTARCEHCQKCNGFTVRLRIKQAA